MGVRVADILRAGPCTAFQRGIPPVVHRAYQAIIGCHTARMGGHAVVCPKGHVEFVAYNACRNRNCPHCAGYRIRRWLESKAQTLLGCPHHHIIFTIPHELNGLCSAAHGNLPGFAWQELPTPLFSTGVASAAPALSAVVSPPI